MSSVTIGGVTFEVIKFIEYQYDDIELKSSNIHATRVLKVLPEGSWGFPIIFEDGKDAGRAR